MFLTKFVCPFYFWVTFPPPVLATLDLSSPLHTLRSTAYDAMLHCPARSFHPGKWLTLFRMVLPRGLLNYAPPILDQGPGVETRASMTQLLRVNANAVSHGHSRNRKWTAPAPLRMMNRTSKMTPTMLKTTTTETPSSDLLPKSMFALHHGFFANGLRPEVWKRMTSLPHQPIQMLPPLIFTSLPMSASGTKFQLPEIFAAGVTRFLHQPLRPPNQIPSLLPLSRLLRRGLPRSPSSRLSLRCLSVALPATLPWPLRPSSSHSWTMSLQSTSSPTWMLNRMSNGRKLF